MNSYPGDSFDRPCPVINAGPRTYARWSFFHAEPSILNTSRCGRSLSLTALPCRVYRSGFCQIPDLCKHEADTPKKRYVEAIATYDTFEGVLPGLCLVNTEKAVH
jgi:hypothetical protein